MSVRPALGFEARKLLFVFGNPASSGGREGAHKRGRVGNAALDATTLDLTPLRSDCNNGRVDFASTRPGYGSGHMDLTRLTQTAGLTCP
jgi:hypothetical protein